MQGRHAWVMGVGLLLLGGCTGTEQPTAPDETAATSAHEPTGFAGDVQEVSERYSALAEDLQRELQEIPADDEDRLVALVDQLREAATAARRDLAELTVPNEVASEMTAVLQLLDDQAAELQRLADAVRDRNTEDFSSATAALVDIAERSVEARRRLDAAIAECGVSCA